MKDKALRDAMISGNTLLLNLESHMREGLSFHFSDALASAAEREESLPALRRVVADGLRRQIDEGRVAAFGSTAAEAARYPGLASALPEILAAGFHAKFTQGRFGMAESVAATATRLSGDGTSAELARAAEEGFSSLVLRQRLPEAVTGLSALKRAGLLDAARVDHVARLAEGQMLSGLGDDLADTLVILDGAPRHLEAVAVAVSYATGRLMREQRFGVLEAVASACDDFPAFLEAAAAGYAEAAQEPALASAFAAAATPRMSIARLPQLAQMKPGGF